MKLELKDKYIKYMAKPKDITIIEIKAIDKEIEFLDYDMNYKNKGYIIYKDIDIFTIEHPFGEDASCASGTIIKIKEYEFDHDIDTEQGSSGCPIIILNNNINLIQVIGIHKEANYSKKLNCGTFIGEIFNDNNNNDIINSNSNILNVKEVPNVNSNLNKYNSHAGDFLDV